MVGWKKSGFPGAQPVSMDRQNLAMLTEKPFKGILKIKDVYVLHVA